MTDTIHVAGGVRLRDGQLIRLNKAMRADPHADATQDTQDGKNRTSPAPRHFDASELAREAVCAALQDAGVTPTDLIGTATGFVAASCFGAFEFLDGLRDLVETGGPRKLRPTDFSIATQGYPASALSMEFQTTGPCTAFVCGATAGHEALAFAKFAITSGQSDRMIVFAYDLDGPRETTLKQMAYGNATRSVSIVALVLERDATPNSIAILEDISSGFTADPTKADPYVDALNVSPQAALPGSGGLSAMFDLMQRGGSGSAGNSYVADKFGAYATVSFILAATKPERVVA